MVAKVQQDLQDGDERADGSAGDMTRRARGAAATARTPARRGGGAREGAQRRARTDQGER